MAAQPEGREEKYAPAPPRKLFSATQACRKLTIFDPEEPEDPRSALCIGGSPRVFLLTTSSSFIMANDEIGVKIFLPVVLIPFVFRPLRLEGEEEKISFLNPTKKKGLHLLDVTPQKLWWS